MNNDTLQHRLEPLRDSGRFTSAQLDGFAAFVRESPDEALFRVNPLEYGSRHKLVARDALDLFVHATRAGIFDFAWGLICPSCSGFLRAREGLRAVARERICGFCDVRAGEALDDGVEVSFTVNAAVRRIRFHGGWAALGQGASLADDAVRLYFSHAQGASGPVVNMIRQGFRGAVVVPRDGERLLKFNLDPVANGKWRLVAPAVHAVVRVTVADDGASSAAVEIDEDRTVPSELTLRPGPVELRVTQRTDQPEQLFAAFRGDHDLLDVDGGDTYVPPPPFVTGRRLLSTQSFRELFRTETLDPDDSLEIRALAMLFTDLKASTQMYERVGDLKALALVREHFSVLREVVARHEGAVVKTIGDAVMATFIDPRHATAAAIEMHRALQRVRPDELQLKIGVHVGPCVAIDSNERLDYFGQTVNIAARVQGLAEGRELVLTDTVLKSPGVSELLRKASLAPAQEQAQLKGIDAPVTVHRSRVE